MPLDYLDRHFSPDFEKKLALIRYESNVAAKLYEYREKAAVKETHMRAAELIGDFIHFYPKGKLGSWQEGPNGSVVYGSKNRQSMTVGKYARAFLNQFGQDNYDSEFEKFNNLIKAAGKPITGHDFRVLRGSDITKYYHGSYYSTSENLGTLGSSCMRGTDNMPMLTMYRENPDRINLLALFSPTCNGKIIGRALLWHTNKGRFMDRVYANDVNTQLFIRWAKDNGVLYCEVQSREAKNILLNGRTVAHSSELMVTDLTLKTDWKYPYLDTMLHLYPSVGVAAGSKVLGDLHYSGAFQSQHGTASSPTGIVSRFQHGAIIPSNMAVQGYACYRDRRSNNADYFFNNEMFMDDQDGNRYNILNMVIGIDGRRYVCDNPNIVFLTGERLCMPAMRVDSVVCFYDGLLYYTKTHTFKALTLKDVDGNTLNVQVRDLYVEKFSERFNLTPEDGVYKVPGLIATHFAAITKQEAAGAVTPAP